jgi:hypothetical protein
LTFSPYSSEIQIEASPSLTISVSLSFHTSAEARVPSATLIRPNCLALPSCRPAIHRSRTLVVRPLLGVHLLVRNAILRIHNRRAFLLLALNFSLPSTQMATISTR